MALPKTAKVQVFFQLIKPIHHNALVGVIFNRYSPLLTKIPSFALPIFRPICTKTHQIYRNDSFSSDQRKIVDGLITIFTHQPISLNNQALKNCGCRLTTSIVETVLKGFKSWRIALMFFNWASNQDGYKHNCYTYTTMASILSNARQNSPLKILASDFVGSRCSITPGALGFFIRCLGSLGMAEEANVLFDRVKEMGLCVPNSYSYNCLLEAIAKSSSVDLAEIRLKEMCDFGFQPDKFTLTPLLQVYCNAGKFRKALDVFKEIYTRGWADAPLVSILALSFSKSGDVDKAFELIEAVEDRNIRLNEKTFCVLIHGFVRESRVEKALELFDKMKKSGFTPDISLYDVLIGGLCKNNDVEKALCLYSEMKEFGISPDVEILAKLFSCLPSEDDMLKLLEDTPTNVDAKDLILQYNSILNVFVSNGLVDKAYHLLQALLGNESHDEEEVNKLLRPGGMVFPNTESFCIVIDGLCKTGKMDLALNLYENMFQSGFEPNLLLYNNLINGLCDSNRLEESYVLLRKMKELGLMPTHFTHNAIFGCLCRREDVVGARDLMKVMRLQGHEPWIKHSTLLVKKLSEHGRVAEACDFLADMVQEGFLPDIIAYSAALHGLVKTHELDRALELFRDICACGYFPDVVAYNVLINGLCKAKRISEAEDILNEMLEKGLVPSVITYNSLIDGWCKTNDTDNALLCLSRMVGKEREPNVITYTTIVDGLCNAGRPDDALLLWNEMETKRCSPNGIAFMALIRGLCKCGRPDAALGFFREMEQKNFKPETYVFTELIDAFLSRTNMGMAFEILKEMVDEGMLPDPSQKNYSLLRDAIIKLCRDATTSSNVKDLLRKGVFPTIGLSDVESEGLHEPFD